MRAMTMFAVLAGALAFAASAAQGGTGTPTVVWHEPWLNWDFLNNEVVSVDDLEIVVDNPNFNPDPLDPTLVNMGPWTQFAIDNTQDFDGNGDNDTIMTWSGTALAPVSIPPGGIAHGGLYMKGSGLVLDAFWTVGGVKQGPSTAITYERTKIVDDPEVHMELTIAPGFYDDPLNASKEVGWTNIRTFVSIPATELNLADLNRTLNLDDFLAYEVTPRRDGPSGAQILTSETIWWGDPDSFFDVFLAQIDPAFAGPGYEALLHADVVTAASPVTIVGEFWNLNPQSPEPATLALMGLGAVATLVRRRRSR